MYGRAKITVLLHGMGLSILLPLSWVEQVEADTRITMIVSSVFTDQRRFCKIFWDFDRMHTWTQWGYLQAT